MWSVYRLTILEERPMPTQQRVERLIATVERHALVEAIDEFYADNVVMQENGHPPTVGKAANRERERGFLASVARFHEVRALSALVHGDRAVIHWIFDYTGTDGGRYRLDQLAWQRWEGDRVVEERFFYDSAAVRAA
jgi:ketosteroid isomerase-like protein